MFAAYLAGLVLGFGLITPIGAQNLFIVSQGMAVGVRRAFWAVATAACCDTLLIVLGAAGVSRLLAVAPAVRTTLLLAGAVFLTYLGVQALRSAGGRLDGDNDAQRHSPRQMVARTASVSLLNPHAILDTVGVIGSAVVAQPAHSRVVFATGTISASWLWFSFLAIGATRLRRHLSGRAAVWFDRLSGAIMIIFAATFLVEFGRAVTR